MRGGEEKRRREGEGRQGMMSGGNEGTRGGGKMRRGGNEERGGGGGIRRGEEERGGVSHPQLAGGRSNKRFPLQLHTEHYTVLYSVHCTVLCALFTVQ